MHLDYKMDKNKTAEQSILASYTDMLKGTAYIGDDEFKDRYSTLCPSLRMVTDMVKIRTKDEESHFVLIAGEPLHKSLAQLGPFVMNTKRFRAPSGATTTARTDLSTPITGDQELP